MRHARIGVALVVSEEQLFSIAGPVLDEQQPGVSERIRSSPYLTLFPASLEDPQVSEPPVTHRFRDPAAGASSKGLPDWWPGDTRPLVYVSFGSVTGGLPVAGSIYAAALAAAARLPARVLLTVGRELDLDALGPAPANVHLERWVPQAEVFGQASVVVCHGGSGTTLGALAAGLPLVIVPLFADQPENARRVDAVGAGIAVPPTPRPRPSRSAPASSRSPWARRSRPCSRSPDTGAPLALWRPRCRRCRRPTPRSRPSADIAAARDLARVCRRTWMCDQGAAPTRPSSPLGSKRRNPGVRIKRVGFNGEVRST